MWTVVKVAIEWAAVLLTFSLLSELTYLIYLIHPECLPENIRKTIEKVENDLD